MNCTVFQFCFYGCKTFNFINLLTDMFITSQARTVILILGGVLGEKSEHAHLYNNAIFLETYFDR